MEPLLRANGHDLFTLVRSFFCWIFRCINFKWILLLRYYNLKQSKKRMEKLAEAAVNTKNVYYQQNVVCLKNALLLGYRNFLSTLFFRNLNNPYILSLNIYPKNTQFEWNISVLSMIYVIYTTYFLESFFFEQQIG